MDDLGVALFLETTIFHGGFGWYFFFLLSKASQYSESGLHQDSKMSFFTGISLEFWMGFWTAIDFHRGKICAVPFWSHGMDVFRRRPTSGESEVGKKHRVYGNRFTHLKRVIPSDSIGIHRIWLANLVYNSNKYMLCGNLSYNYWGLQINWELGGTPW